jgi:hypothetical protein
MNAGVDEELLLHVVEVLRFVADLCTAEPEGLNVALCRFTNNYYPAHHLRDEVVEVGDQLAKILGFADLSLEVGP